jgi:hypothetical protein
MYQSKHCIVPMTWLLLLCKNYTKIKRKSLIYFLLGNAPFGEFGLNIKGVFISTHQTILPHSSFWLFLYPEG